MIRPVAVADTSALLAVAVSTGLFQPEEAEGLLGGVLADLPAGRLGDGHAALAWIDGASDAPVGWTYFAPDPHADAVWNLWWIGVEPPRHGHGIGEALLRAVEAAVRAVGGRLLIIETSALPALARTRRFYANRGYAMCGVVPDFYAPGDGKVIFAKRVDSHALGAG